MLYAITNLLRVEVSSLRGESSGPQPSVSGERCYADRHGDAIVITTADCGAGLTPPARSCLQPCPKSRSVGQPSSANLCATRTLRSTIDEETGSRDHRAVPGIAGAGGL